ncbi:hypothetical protein M2T78_00225 [Elizabethkingia ursingii]|uniref:hypothetical protein n=1 Tax=Elizabethkingia ursingii TaxID=1756150 RepID=UPI0020120DEA|nr:hypothetical protein [Elizabethkingia ursingii]MCL1662661.1 hypothetical protein [Elizabethkingia ursingii]
MKKIIRSLYYQYLLLFNHTIKKQRKDTSEIPVIIINFNQLHYLKQLVDFLLIRNFKNIIIIDNKSDYPQLLDYYREINNEVTIELMDKNYGHKVFFESKELLSKYGKGYYILTDSDIIPNHHLPQNFVDILISVMEQNFEMVNKVGFALDLKSIPDTYPVKTKVLKWENQYWENELDKDIYLAHIDTTFALYKPGYPKRFKDNDFYKAIRIAGNFTAIHGGWYINPKELSEENKHYLKTSNNSASWKINENGELAEDTMYIE